MQISTSFSSLFQDNFRFRLNSKEKIKRVRLPGDRRNIEKTIIDKTAEITSRAMQIPRQFLFSVDAMAISCKDRWWSLLIKKNSARQKIVLIVDLFFSTADWTLFTHSERRSFVILIKSHYSAKLPRFITVGPTRITLHRSYKARVRTSQLDSIYK